MTVTSTDYESIDSFALHPGSDFSLYGVYIGMDVQEARQLLTGSGWSEQGPILDIGYSFTNENGEIYDFWFMEGDTVEAITVIIEQP